MKSKLLIFTFLFFSGKLIAQFVVVQPEVFSLAKNSNFPCPVSDMGKIFYNSNENIVMYCKDLNTTEYAFSYWEGSSDIYYMGKIGINSNTPSYDFDVSGIARFSSLSVNDKVGINTITPTEKLDLLDRRISIKSTADVKNWGLINSEASDWFEFREQGSGGVGGRMNIKYGGNIGIGNAANTDKLRVDGDVSYAGSLSIETKGTLSNTNASQLLIQEIITSPTGINFFINKNTCKTKQFYFPNQFDFSQAPVVILGQANAINGSHKELVISIETVTTSGGVIRLCNNTGLTLTVDDEVRFSLIAIGQ